MEKRIAFAATFIISVIFSLARPLAAAGGLNITAVFAFGDSTLDAGNNNHLHTLVRADHVPYGRDLPTHRPSGSLYLSDTATGVSFASGASGLDDLTARLAQVMTMKQELRDFKEYSKRLRQAMGKQKADEIIRNALFVIGIGSNDWIMSCSSFPIRRHKYSKAADSRILIGQLRSFVEVFRLSHVTYSIHVHAIIILLGIGWASTQELYSEGGRRFAISDLAPLGCLPMQITQAAMVPIYHTPQRRCVPGQNRDAVAYNSLLRASISNISSSLLQARFLYVDAYNSLMHMINNPKQYGFEVTALGCCGTRPVEMGPLCNKLTTVCSSPSTFMFRDALHPSETTYRHLAERLRKDALPSLRRRRSHGNLGHFRAKYMLIVAVSSLQGLFIM
ncbi:GDSL-like Lipase/Acylhydrolase [Musa troglodytarum]|uniref:GDSL-like Lipase/Acylhydrolase n=1 Tax=Musa troglodytarum TaxID=320322 RepID=A0A9E7J9S2_9LILI|nr:GDSL-like Lipase/Acylhydrolase [Musa troglodytarum]